MMRPVSLIIFAAALMACASPARLPIEDHKQVDYRAANFNVLKARLIRTGAGLMRANADQCAQTRTITTQSETFPICAVKVGIEQSPIPNAHTNGQTILVTTAMIDALSVDELSFIIAHELAHSVAGHAIEQGSYPAAELEADAIAIALMARAGYDVRAAITALQSLAIDKIAATSSHPSGAARIARIRSAIDRL